MKISKKLSGKPRPWQIGKNNPNWNDGSSSLGKLIRNSIYYKNWRTEVFSRDNWTCQKCGATGVLNADHIKPLSLLIKENNINTIEQAIQCFELWDCANGITLCIPCHRKTETYGYRAVTYARI